MSARWLLATLSIAILLCGTACGQMANLSPSFATATPNPKPPLTTTVPAPAAAPGVPALPSPQTTPTLQWPADKPTPVPLVNPEGPVASRTVVAAVHPQAIASNRITTATFADAAHGWLALGQTILATSDGGKQWIKRLEAPGQVYDLDFVSSKQGWAATRQGLFATKDGGQTWAKVDVTTTDPVSQVDFVDDSHGWIAGGDGSLLRTSDGGMTWRRIANPCPRNVGVSPFSFTFTGSNTGWTLCGGVPSAGSQMKQLFKTEDGGQRWQLVAEGPPREMATPGISGSLPVHGYVGGLFFLDDTTGWLSEARGGLFATSDGGRSWQWVRLGDSDGEQWLSKPHLVSTQQGFVVWSFGNNTALLATSDGGATWSQIYPPLFPLGPLYPVLYPLEPFQTLDGKTGFGVGTALDPGAILKTTDGGRNWQQVASFRQERICSMSFPDAQHGWVSAERLEGSATVSTLYRTVDGGHTWTPVSSTTDSKELFRYLSFVDANTGFVGSAYGHLSVTHDGGLTFTSLDRNDSRGSLVKFKSKDVGCRLIDLRLYTTADGGKSWTPVPLGYRVSQFDLLPDGQMWVVAGDCRGSECRPILVSTSDSGRSWTRHDLGELQPRAVAFTGSSHGWLSEEQGHVYSTEDGGKTWTQLW